MPCPVWYIRPKLNCALDGSLVGCALVPVHCLPIVLNDALSSLIKRAQIGLRGSHCRAQPPAGTSLPPV